MGVITVITSGKGGVGKSTTAAHLGMSLASHGRKVLLIDCDAGLGCLDLLLGISEKKVFDLADVISGTAYPSQAIYETDLQKGLYVLPAPSNEKDLISKYIMKELTHSLSKYYDHILLDCPAGIGNGFRSAAFSAQRALVVCTTDKVSVTAAAHTREQLTTLGINEQRLVINRFSYKFFKESSFFSSIDSIIDQTGLQLIGVIPEDNNIKRLAVKSFTPANSPAALAYRRLSQRLEGAEVSLPDLKNY